MPAFIPISFCIPKVNTFIHNKYFGLGEPDYTALGTKLPQWIAVKVPESG